MKRETPTGVSIRDDRDDLEMLRRTIEASLHALAEARRDRRRIEAQRKAATEALRKELEAAEAPFKEREADLSMIENELTLIVQDSLDKFESARRAELLAGRECKNVQRPEGVSTRWMVRPIVEDLEALPEEYVLRTADMAALRKVIADEAVPGVRAEKTLVITVRE